MEGSSGQQAAGSRQVQPHSRTAECSSHWPCAIRHMRVRSHRLYAISARAYGVWTEGKAVSGGRFFPYAIRHNPYAVRKWPMAYSIWCMALLLLVAAVASASEAATRVAILPFQNVSGHLEAPPIAMPIIYKAMQDRGYEVVEAKSLEPFLFRNRIRATEKIRREQLISLGKELDASLALVGSIDLFADTPGNPQWGISGRLLATDRGSILWAGAAGYTGDDFTGFLGLGTVTIPDRLAALTVDRLLSDLPPAGVRLDIAGATWAASNRKALAKIFRDPRLDTEAPKRVAVLPFENGTERRGAALIVDDLLVVNLVRVGLFEMADPGEVAYGLQTLGLAPYGAIDLDALRSIGDKTGVDAVILGRVEDYNEGLRPGMSTSPSIAMDARMLDTKTGKILWMGYHEGRGEEYQFVLEFGKIKSMVPLAMRVIGEMISTMEPSPRLPSIPPKQDDTGR